MELVPPDYVKLETSSELCLSCKKLVASQGINKYSLFQPSYAVLSRSAQSCGLCRLVKRGLTLEDAELAHPFCRLPMLIEDKETNVWAIRRIRTPALESISWELEFVIKRGLPTPDQNKLLPATTAFDDFRFGKGQACIWGLDLHLSQRILGQGDDEFANRCHHGFEYSHRSGMATDMTATSRTVMSSAPTVDMQDDDRAFMGIERHEENGSYHRTTLKLAIMSESIHELLLPSETQQAISDSRSSRLRLGRYWLKQCMDDHAECRKWQDSQSTPLPSRVLFVGEEDNKSGVRLHETQPGDTGSYVCLSHRWGGSKVLTSTTETLEARKSCIQVEELPRTFREAIEITRYLGFQYIWIDSLCILQDKLEDWEQEAGRMGSIYRNAVLTIVAAGATSADSGCFSFDDYEDKRLNVPCEVGTYLVNQGCDQGHTEHRVKVFARVPEEMQSRARTNDHRRRGPLDTRGWVLQEEVLSARALIFGQDGVHWECICKVKSEAVPEGMEWNHRATLVNNPHRGTADVFVKPAHYARRFKRLILGENPSSFDLYNTWCEVVENFTTRDLTNDTDRLVALAGLTSIMSQALKGDTCLAGIWQNDLAKQLTWCASDVDIRTIPPCDCPRHKAIAFIDESRPRRAITPGLDGPAAPSWSWAQMNQKVQYLASMDLGSPYLQFMEADISEKARRTRGRLVLRGMVKIACAVPWTKEEFRVAGSSGKLAIQNRSLAPSDSVYFADYPDWKGGQVVCLPSTISLTELSGLKPTLLCLLLEPTPDCALVNRQATKLEFRRVGLAALGREGMAEFGVGADFDFPDPRPQNHSNRWVPPILQPDIERPLDVILEII